MAIEPVEPVTPSDLQSLGIRVRARQISPSFVFEDGVLWRSACWIHKYDDGRMTVVVVAGLDSGSLRTVYGLAEKYFLRDTPRDWTRYRRCKSRPVGRWTSHFYVQTAPDDPMLAVVAAAEYGTVVADLVSE